MLLSKSTLFEVRQDPLEQVQEEALATLNATRRNPVNADRFAWLYGQNPDGPAVLWSVREVASGIMAGFTVALPRRILVDGQIRIGWIGADFSMNPKFRTLGPAMKLRRAAKDEVDAGRVDFLYSHPNERMAVIHGKVGHLPVGRMVRYAKPLRITPYLEQRFNRLGGALGRLADPLWGRIGPQWNHRFSTQVRCVSPARFDERFDQLFQQATDSARVLGVRDAAYLNWRYAQNPLYQTDALVAEQDGKLKGYLLLVEQNEAGQVKDIFPPHQPQVARDLVAAVLRHGRARGLSSISFTALETNSLLPVFSEFGFRERSDSSQMFAYASAESPLRDLVTDPRAWFLTVGDRDV